MAEPEDEAPPVLLPCSFCTRTFKPESLDKHLKVCEKQTSKKRKVFDSSKQRIQGTELAEFLPKILREKKNEKVVTKKPESKWKEKHLEFVAAIRAARGVETAPVPVPKSSNERCPHCDRNFGPKAFDRHIEWCKDQKARIPKSPASIQAKERLEARTKYRAPPLAKSKRTLTREKYARVSSSKESSPLGSRSAVAFSKPQPQDVKVSETTSRIQGVRNKPKLSSSSPSCTLPSGNMQVKRREPSPSPSKRPLRSNSKPQRKGPVATRNEETNNHASLFSSSCNITKMRPTEEKRRGRDVKPSPIENRPCSRKVSLPLPKSYKRRAEPTKRHVVFGTLTSKRQDESKCRSAYAADGQEHHNGNQEILLGESLNVKGTLNVVDPSCDPVRKSNNSQCRGSKNEALKLNDITVNKEIEGLIVSSCSIYPLNSSSVTWKDVAKCRSEVKGRGESDVETDECYTTVTTSSFTDEDVQSSKIENSSPEITKCPSSAEEVTSVVHHKEELKFCVDSPQYISGDCVQEREVAKSILDGVLRQSKDFNLFPCPQEIPKVAKLIEHKQNDAIGLSEGADEKQNPGTKDKSHSLHPDTSFDGELENKDNERVDESLSFIKNSKYLEEDTTNHVVKCSIEEKCKKSQDIHLATSALEISELPSSDYDVNKLPSNINVAEVSDWQKLRSESGSHFLCSDTSISETEFDKFLDNDFDSSSLNDIIDIKHVSLIGGTDDSSFLQSSHDVFESRENTDLATVVDNLVGIENISKTSVMDNLNVSLQENLLEIKDNTYSDRQNNLICMTNVKTEKVFEEQEETTSVLQEEPTEQENILDRTFSISEFKTCTPNIDSNHNVNFIHQTEIFPNYVTEESNLITNTGPETGICSLLGDAVQMCKAEQHLKCNKMSSSLVEFCEDFNPLDNVSNNTVSKEEQEIKDVPMKEGDLQFNRGKLCELESNRSEFETVLPTIDDKFYNLSSTSLDTPHCVTLVLNDPEYQNDMLFSISEQAVDKIRDIEISDSSIDSVCILEERNSINKFSPTLDEDICTNVTYSSLESCLLHDKLDPKESRKRNNDVVSENITCEGLTNEQIASNCLPNLEKNEICGSDSDSISKNYSQFNEYENDIIKKSKGTNQNIHPSCKKSCVCCFENDSPKKEIDVQPHCEEEVFDFLNKCNLLDDSITERCMDTHADRIWDLASREFIETVKRNPFTFRFTSNETTKLNSSTQVCENDIFEECRTSITVGKKRRNFDKIFYPPSAVLLSARFPVHKYKHKANFKKIYPFKKKQRKKFLESAKKSYDREEPEVKKRLLRNLSKYCDPSHSSVGTPISTCERLVKDHFSFQNLHSENLNINLKIEDVCDSDEPKLSNFNAKERLSTESSENILECKLPQRENYNSLNDGTCHSENNCISECCSNVLETVNANVKVPLKSTNDNISPWESFNQKHDKELVTVAKMLSEKRDLIIFTPKTHIYRIDASVFIKVFDIMKFDIMSQLLCSKVLRYTMFLNSDIICCKPRSFSKQCGNKFEKYALQLCHLSKEKNNNCITLEVESSRGEQETNYVFSDIYDANETCVEDISASGGTSTFHKKNDEKYSSEHGHHCGDGTTEKKFLMIDYRVSEAHEVGDGLSNSTQAQKEVEEIENVSNDCVLVTCDRDNPGVEYESTTCSAGEGINDDLIRENESYVSVKMPCEKDEFGSENLEQCVVNHFYNETQISHKKIETETTTIDFQNWSTVQNFSENDSSTSLSFGLGKDEDTVAFHRFPNFLSNVITFDIDEHNDSNTYSKLSSEFVGNNCAHLSLEYLNSSSLKSELCPYNSQLEASFEKSGGNENEEIGDNFHDKDLQQQSFLDNIVHKFPSELSVRKIEDDCLSEEEVCSTNSIYYNEPQVEEKYPNKYVKEISETDKTDNIEMMSLELQPINFYVSTEDEVVTPNEQENKLVALISATEGNISVPEFFNVSNLNYQEIEIYQMLKREIQLLEKCVFSVNLPAFLFEDEDKDEELNVKIWTASIKIPPRNLSFSSPSQSSSNIISIDENEEPLKETVFQEKLSKNMYLLRQNNDNLFELNEKGISNYNVVANPFRQPSNAFLKGVRKSISDTHCSILATSKQNNQERRLRKDMSLYDLAMNSHRDSAVTQFDRVALPEIPNQMCKKHKIRSAQDHDTSFLKLVEKWSTKDKLLKRSESVEALNRKCSKEYIPFKQQIHRSHRLPPLPSSPKSSSQSSSGNEEIYDPYVSAERQMMELLGQGDFVQPPPQQNKSTRSSQAESPTIFPSFDSSHRSAFVSPEPRFFPSSKSHYEKGDADKKIAEEAYMLKCESSASGELFSQPKSYSAGGKFSADSAYGSLNRRSPTHSASQLSNKPEDLDADRMCFMSSSSSESSLPPLCSVQVTKRDASNSSLSPTSSRAVDASPVMQNVPRMSKFCHECGSKFPVSLAKFCCECGVRRLAM